MRKGFDRSLAMALNTTRGVLFVDYVSIPPNAATRVFPFPTVEGPTDEKHRPPERSEPGSLLGEVMVRLFAAEREKVAEYAIQLVLAKNDTRRPEFERFQRVLAAGPTRPPNVSTTSTAAPQTIMPAKNLVPNKSMEKK